MKVLVACEYSGVVRDAFVEKGHDAWSCDILPTETKAPAIPTPLNNESNIPLAVLMYLSFSSSSSSLSPKAIAKTACCKALNIKF